MNEDEVKLNWIRMQLFNLMKIDGDSISKSAIQAIFELSSELTQSEMQNELDYKDPTVS
jgi:hypothetical protein